VHRASPFSVVARTVSRPALVQHLKHYNHGRGIVFIGHLEGSTPAPSPQWGLHLLDANLSLGNLISIVHSEAKAFARRD
jgi:hypothetical protein